MSISAILKGIETRLRSASVLNDQPTEAIGKVCGVQPNPGRPPPGAGQYYFSVHWSGGRQTDRNPQCHDVLQAVVVTITARLGYAPKDRRGKQITTVGNLLDIADTIFGPNVIHGNYDVLAAANALIPGTKEYLVATGGDPATTTINGYVEPLVGLDYGPEREESPDWVGSEAEVDVYTIPVRFGDARRIRAYTG